MGNIENRPEPFFGVYEVREFINGRTDWYSHWFESPGRAEEFIADEGFAESEWGADIIARRFDPSQVEFVSLYDTGDMAGHFEVVS